MPRFTDTTGAEVFIPYHALLVCRAQAGGLETMVCFGSMTLAMSGQGMQAQPFNLVVQGTFDTIVKAFEKEALLLGASGWSTVGGAQ